MKRAILSIKWGIGYKSRLIIALVYPNYLQARIFKKIHFFSIGISCLKLIVVADTRSLIIAYIKELNIRNLYREGKKYKQPIQMYCYSWYKCSRYSDAFPIITLHFFS